MPLTNGRINQSRACPHAPNEVVYQSVFRCKKTPWILSVVASCLFGGLLSFLAVEYFKPSIVIAPYLLHCKTPYIDDSLSAEPPGKYAFQVVNTSPFRAVLNLKFIVYHEKATLIGGEKHLRPIVIDEGEWHYLDRRSWDTDRSERPYEHGNILMFSLTGQPVEGTKDSNDTTAVLKISDGNGFVKDESTIPETTGGKLHKIIENLTHNEYIRLVVIAEDAWTRRTHSFEKRFYKRNNAEESQLLRENKGIILEDYEFDCEAIGVGAKRICDHR